MASKPKPASKIPPPNPMNALEQLGGAPSVPPTPPVAPPPPIAPPAVKPPTRPAASKGQQPKKGKDYGFTK